MFVASSYRKKMEEREHLAREETVRVAARTRSLQIADVWRKETRGIETMPRRGEDDPPRDTREFGLRGSRGATMMPALEIIYRREYYPVLRLSLILLKCMYSHWIVHLKLALRS
jgi:hypothetical protein